MEESGGHVDNSESRKCRKAPFSGGARHVPDPPPFVNTHRSRAMGTHAMSTPTPTRYAIRMVVDRWCTLSLYLAFRVMHSSSTLRGFNYAYIRAQRP